MTTLLHKQKYYLNILYRHSIKNVIVGKYQSAHIFSVSIMCIYMKKILYLVLKIYVQVSYLLNKTENNEEIELGCVKVTETNTKTLGIEAYQQD